MKKVNTLKYTFLPIILFIVLIIHFPILNSISDHGLKLSVELTPDTQYSMSVLEWNLYALENDIQALYHLNYFYPNAYITFLGHPLFGETLVFFIFDKVFSADLITSYNLYILFGFWIGGIGIFLFAKEITNRTPAAYFASLLFIIYPSIKRSAEILNIFSFFWVGFVLYFLIKFWKSNKIKDGLLCGFFIFLQGIFSIYHGYFLIALLLPIFFFFLLFYKYISLKAVLKFVLSILPFLILLVAVFHPFLNTIQNYGLERTLHYKSLVDSNQLFTSESMILSSIHSGVHPLKRFFPGFGVLALFLIAFLEVKNRRILLFLSTTFQLMTVFLLNLLNLNLWANLLLILIAIQIFIYFIINLNKFSKELKLLLSVFFVYNSVFFKFSSIIPGFKFSIYGLLINLIPQFSNFRYLYRGLFLIFPVLIIISTIGFLKLVDNLKNKKRYILLLLPIIILFENWNYVNYNKNIKFETKKYRKIEKRRDKIILEIPIFIPGYFQIKNSQYTINTFSHYNYYINGRVAYSVFNENNEVFKRVFINKSFPDERNIKYLIERFSTNYIIFNLNKKLRYSKTDIIERVNKLTNYCKLIDSDKNFIVIKLLENFPKKILKRRFSLFHIKNRKIKIQLQNPYKGNVKISFPKKHKTNVITINNKSEFYINFPKINPDIKGNEFKLEFDSKIMLKNFDLVK